ncbi:ATP cone domain-containing protein [Guggenheimella bovis]
MKLLKKDGRIQDYDVKKLETSLLLTADDIQFPLSQKEAELLGKKVTEILTSLRGEDGLTSSFEVRGVTVEVLLENKYKDLSRHFSHM